MRTVIMAIAGIFAGYVIGNLEYKTFEEIMDRISDESSKWIYVIKKFIGETLNDLEGFDSDQIKINIDAFVNALTDKIDEVSKIESFNEKISFVEEEITNVAENIIKKKGKINNKWMN